jgi:hypothetical protein
MKEENDMAERRWISRLLAALVISLTALIGFHGPSTHAANNPIPEDGGVQGLFTFAAGPSGLNTTNTIPYFKSSFSFQGTTYPFAMVGNDPSSNSSVTLPTVIIPLKFVFSPASNLGGGQFSDVRDPFTMVSPWNETSVQATLDSPIFQSSTYPFGVGTTQWGDAIMRADFNKTGASGYHVLLGQPTVLPEVTIDVPANQADVHRISARIDAGWFSTRINDLMNSMQIDPHALVIFATYDTLLYLNNNPAVCCVLGYHGAMSPVVRKFGGIDGNGKQPLQTFIYTSWVSPGITAPGAFGPFDNASPFSHEVAEWTNDPFVDNAVPPWLAIAPPPSFCQGNLETGDVLEATKSSFANLTTSAGVTYTIQSEALLPWFARQSPSTAVNGIYSFPDNTIAPTFAQSC